MNQFAYPSSFEYIIQSLEATPTVLEDMLAEIPKSRLKEKRIPGKWTIHEQACHICIGDQYVLHPRLEQFINEDEPTFKPYSGESFADDYLINLDLHESLKTFKNLRTKSILMIQNLDPYLWDKEGAHPEYTVYTPRIMVRHFLMHDYFHLYRIEELWLTKNL